MYAINEALNLTLFTGTTPVLFSDYANTSGLEFSNDTVYAKTKGVDTIRFDKNRRQSISFDFEVFDMKYLALMLGADQKVGTTNIHKVETAVVSSNKFTVKGTPIANSIVVFTTKADGRTHDKALTVTATGSEVSIGGTPSTPDGTKVIAYYLTAANEKTTTTTINVNKFAKNYKIIGQGLSKDTLGNLVPIEFELPNAIPQGNVSLSLGDNVATLSMKFDAFGDINGDAVIIKEIVEA